MRMSDWSSYECSSDLQGTPVGTATDDGGQYTLVGLETGTTLVFRMVGYKSQEFQYAGQSQLEVMLETEDGNREAVIVVGFGPQEKSNLKDRKSVVEVKGGLVRVDHGGRRIIKK